MSKIDEIMGAIGRHGDDCIRDADAASESFDELREMIAAALAEVRQIGDATLYAGGIYDRVRAIEAERPCCGPDMCADSVACPRGCQ